MGKTIFLREQIKTDLQYSFAQIETRLYYEKYRKISRGVRLPNQTLAHLFEQFIELELMRAARLLSPHIKLKYWCDSAGPEIDFVIDNAHQYIPVEVKWSTHPTLDDTKHLQKFMREYTVETGYVVCQTPKIYEIFDNIFALP
jgi:predicted AAA+ superfamily ATPase